MHVITWLRRWFVQPEPVPDPIIPHWPTPEKITAQQADELRARAAMRRTLAAKKYAEARAITSGEAIGPTWRVVRKP